VPLAVVLAEQLAVRPAEVLVVRPGEQDDAAFELLFELRQRAAEDGDLLPAYIRQSVIASTIAYSLLPPPTAPP
jgi:hypothetical protein